MINYIFIGVAFLGLIWEAYDILTFKKQELTDDVLREKYKSVYISRGLWVMLVFLLLLLRSVSKLIS